MITETSKDNMDIASISVPETLKIHILLKIIGHLEMILGLTILDSISQSYLNAVPHKFLITRDFKFLNIKLFHT